MNLFGMALGLVTQANPQRPASLQVSTGYTVTAAKKQVPTYSTSAIAAQVQAMSDKDLRQVEALNLQGSLFKVYAYGPIDAIVRVKQKGGDIITFTDTGEVYLVSIVLERWPGWCSLACTLQNGS